MLSRHLTIVCWLAASMQAVSLVVPYSAVAQIEEASRVPEALDRGQKVLRREPESHRYTTSWALIIGIDYQGRELASPRDRLALPPLGNAEKDARAIHELLTTHYGYAAEHTRLLIGETATDAAIRQAIGALRDPQVVQSNDSVLVFFAGHGDKIEGEPLDRAAIYPYDVQLSNGKPINNYISLYSDLFGKLRTSPATHKLVMLDSCYSGEILKAGFHSASEIDDRGSLKLFHEPAFQAMTSCRAFQVATDGQGIHSPFTTAVLKGLQHLPARESGLYLDGIWASGLFSYVAPQVRSQSESQQPQFGILEGDGEFRFFPQGDFARYKLPVDEQKLLRSMVASSLGDWWFAEIPWFIPSLRERIVARLTPERGSVEAVSVSRDQLREIIGEMIDESTLDKTVDRSANQSEDKASLTADQLFSLRCGHAKLLLDAHGTPRFKAALGELISSLESFGDRLQAPDLHLLATAHHQLANRETGSKHYLAAIKQYQGEADSRALLALCHADFGQFQMDVTKSPASAANSFRAADREFGSDAPAPFRIFVLCKEADAWLNRNRWAEVDERLGEARQIAETCDSGQQLSAYVYSKLAWARMIQWEIDAAEHWFKKSNLALKDAFAGSGPMPDSKSATTPDKPTLGVVEADDAFQIDEYFHQWSSHDAKIAYLHNLHGLAMVLRFKGRSDYAAQKYRWLSAQVEDTLTLLMRTTVRDHAGGDIEVKLYERLINTLERLGDCNLFGDPALRDPKEAIDDYRRALARCHRVSEGRQSGLRCQLLYKLALGMALPPVSVEGNVQDSGLALTICDEADRIYEQLYRTADPVDDGQREPGSMLLALGELVTRIVTLVHVSDGHATTIDTSQMQAVTNLRDALQDFRDRNGPHLHRDQIEICLIGARVLLEHANEPNRFLFSEDTELLQSYCRLALTPYQITFDSTSGSSTRGETTAYLRPYYDCVIRAKLQSSPKQITDLLEIQSEATRGEYYVKPEHAMPTFALYVMDDQCYLLVDLPRGASRCVELSNQYRIDEVRSACLGETEPLELPREVFKELLAWKLSRTDSEQLTDVSCHWKDPIHQFVPLALANAEQGGDTVLVSRAAEDIFPFMLPSGFRGL